MSEEDEYLRKYKPEGEDAHYYECVSCGCGPDGSYTFSEFGLCLGCLQKWKKKVPRQLQPYVGRVFLFGMDRHKKIAEKAKFIKITEEKPACPCEGKEINRRQIIYKEVSIYEQ